MPNSHATDSKPVGTTPDRPDDCDCYDGMLARGLPCWPCYRAGFELPNPQPPEGDD